MFLVQKAGEGFVEIDQEKYPDLIEQFKESGYEEWDGETTVAPQQAEANFREWVLGAGLQIHPEDRHTIAERKNPLRPDDGVCRIGIDRDTGLKWSQGVPDNLSAQLDAASVPRRL